MFQGVPQNVFNPPGLQSQDVAEQPQATYRQPERTTEMSQQEEIPRGSLRFMPNHSPYVPPMMGNRSSPFNPSGASNEPVSFTAKIVSGEKGGGQ